MKLRYLVARRTSTQSHTGRGATVAGMWVHHKYAACCTPCTSGSGPPSSKGPHRGLTFYHVWSQGGKQADGIASVKQPPYQFAAPSVRERALAPG